MFHSELKDLEKRLKMPYPERGDFIREVAGDLQHLYTKLRSEGLSNEQASKKALSEIYLSHDDMVVIDAVHESTAAKLVHKLPSPLSKLIRDYSGTVPLLVFFIFSTKEVSMMEFLREGGLPAVIAVLVMGGVGLAINLKHAFRWFVLRDHSDESLKNFSNGPLYLAAATLLAGIVNTAVGYRLVFSRWSQDHFSDSVARAGLSEPLASLIVAATAAGLVILLHGWLSTWRTNITRSLRP